MADCMISPNGGRSKWELLRLPRSGEDDCPDYARGELANMRALVGSYIDAIKERISEYQGGEFSVYAELASDLELRFSRNDCHLIAAMAIFVAAQVSLGGDAE